MSAAQSGVSDAVAVLRSLAAEMRAMLEPGPDALRLPPSPERLASWADSLERCAAELSAGPGESDKRVVLLLDPRADRVLRALQILLAATRGSWITWHVWAPAPDGTMRCVLPQCAACAAEREAEALLRPGRREW